MTKLPFSFLITIITMITKLTKDFPSEKYEETAEAAIKYCLKNLI